MSKSILFNFEVDKENNEILVERSFNAPLGIVWAAWTEAEILDQWWAPKPWKAETKYMDFREGGHWLYAMVGPEGEKHWSRVDYVTISPQKSFTTFDGFCHEEGSLNDELPNNKWEVNFSDRGESTLVHVRLIFDSFEDLETIIQMGFQEGFTAGLENLDQYIASKSR
jgi:PhnB protein